METGILDGDPARIIQPGKHSIPEATREWFRLRSRVDHYCLPQLLAVDKDKTNESPIVETWKGVQTLNSFLETHEDLSELSSVYITLQTAMILDMLLEINAVMPTLDVNEFVVDDTEAGLPRVVYLGWKPPEFVHEGSWEPDAVQFLARVLYRCLTGVQPPSEQVSAESPELELTDLGFDNLFLSWVTEEKDLGTLGEAAMNALRPSDTGWRIATFISEVYPHLRRATNEAIEHAVQKLATDRGLLAEAEKHRQSLKEHRTRQRYLSGWLMDNAPKIESDGRALASTEQYLSDMKTFANDLRRRLSESSKGKQSAPRTPAEHSAPEAAPLRTDTSENPKDKRPETAFISFQSLADQTEPNNRFEIQTLEPNDLESLDDVEAAEPPPLQPQPDIPAKGRSLWLFLLIVMTATLLGVIGAWSLLSHASGDSDATDSTHLNTGR